MRSGASRGDWLPVFDLLGDYRLQRFLREQGYRCVHIGPKWNPTAHNRFADENVRFATVPEFTMMLVSTTMLYPLLYRLGLDNPDLEKYQRVQYQLNALEKLPRMSLSRCSSSPTSWSPAALRIQPRWDLSPPGDRPRARRGHQLRRTGRIPGRPRAYLGRFATGRLPGGQPARDRDPRRRRPLPDPHATAHVRVGKRRPTKNSARR